MITLVLVSGVSGSGKSTIAQRLAEHLQPHCHLFQQDQYFTTPFVPYGQRQDASYEDGSGVDWNQLQTDMESVVVEGDAYILVEGHMLGLALSTFLRSFEEHASIFIVALHCSRQVSKQRRLNRQKRSEDETNELSLYIDQYVWPAYLQYGLPALDALRSSVSSRPHRNIQLLELSADEDDSFHGNVEKILTFLQQSATHRSQDEIIDQWPSLLVENNLQGFAQHHPVTLRWDRTPDSTFSLDCVGSLTPIDMIHLSQGAHDATGSSVWMGAYNLLEALAANVTYQQQQSDQLLVPPTRVKSLRDVFSCRRVLELGCGTGVAGLSLLLSTTTAKPVRVVFTDNDEAVLNLCRRNCEQNRVESSICAFEHLDWGGSSRTETNGTYDTVLATDVLYDLECWKPLLVTTVQCLRSSGTFVLAHVPRSCLPEREDETTGVERDYHKSLEDYIIQTSKDHGLSIVGIIRPEQIQMALGDDNDMEPLNDMSLQEMEEAGAAILIFQKEETLRIQSEMDK